MKTEKSYASPVGIGDVMVGGTVSEVIASKLENYAPGDIVEGRTGWQEYALSDGTGMRKVNPALAPITTALGVLGMPGRTAYFGLLSVGQPKPDETVVVSAAAGAVGAIVGQLAKIKGCRVVGIAGVPEKCRYVVKELGFDACISHYEPDLGHQLEKACPKGVDIYFENVGGKVFEAVLPLLNEFARIPVCGLIAHYNDSRLPEGPNQVPRFLQDRPKTPPNGTRFHQQRFCRSARTFSRRYEPLGPRGSHQISRRHCRRAAECAKSVSKALSRRKFRKVTD